MNRRRGIRWHLFQVQLVSIIPIGLFAAALLYFHWQAQEHERQRSQMESVRLLAAAADNALDSSVERLSIFARAWSSRSLNEQAVYAQAKEALAANADWTGILAFDAKGEGVFRSDAPLGASIPAHPRFDIWEPVFVRREPVVSDLVTDPVTGSEVIQVGVPVVRDGRVAYVLIANLDLRWYDRLLTKQGLAEGAVAAVFDRNYKFIARSTEGEERRGKDPTPGFVDDMKKQSEGVGRYTNLNRTAVYTAWTFSRHAWPVGFATPSGPSDDAFWSHLLLFGFVWAAAMAVGMVYAASKGRVLAASLESIEKQAGHFAAGERIDELPATPVAEVKAAFEALEKASALLQSTMRERDRAFETEREARAFAEAANQAKDEFLAMLGHELRNPLAAIVTASAILKNERRTPGQVDFATGVIERQSRHLKRLIDDLLDVARAMTGKILSERKPLDLALAARRVVATMQAADQFVERRVDVEAASVWVEGDQTRIEQILNNLLANAARYTPPGGHIRVRVTRVQDEALLEVVDDGRGIAADDLKRVFELFFQASPTMDRSAGGLGVGLTLVKRLVRMHGGEVSAQSGGAGKGATFTVRLPAIAPPDRPPATAAPVRHARGETVLLVEDNADARESLTLALELQGYSVLQAPDGVTALEVMRSARPPIAVLDVGLPRMDGYELARRARAELGSEIVLIALTGYGTARDEDAAVQAGFDRHLTKPVDVKELIQAIDSLRRPQTADIKA